MCTIDTQNKYSGVSVDMAINLHQRNQMPTVANIDTIAVNVRRYTEDRQFIYK